MFNDPIYGMMVDENTAKHASEIEGNRMSIYSLLRKRVSSMRGKRMRTPPAAIAAVVVQINTMTEGRRDMVNFFWRREVK
jgi:hypothetical protein